MTSAAGPSLDVAVPEDTRMRNMVRRGAAFALVGMTMHTVLFLLFTVLQIALEFEARSVLLLKDVLDAVSAPLIVLAAFGLRAYPRNRAPFGSALLVVVGVAAVLRLLRINLIDVQLGSLGAVVEFSAALLLLLAADRILRDGAGDPTGPRSRIARIGMGIILVLAIGFAVVPRAAPALIPLLTGMSLVVVAVEIVAFLQVRRLML